MITKIRHLLISIIMISCTCSVAAHPKTKPHQSIWPIIRNEFRINYNPNRYEIRQQIEWYKHNKHYVYDILKKAGPIIYYIAQQAKNNDMPAELALIPFIESEYDPIANSSAGAAGLWQFMPQTANAYGLTINKWYDDRLDIQKSTRSALQYFHYLNEFFAGNWILAMAAYDSGEGKVLNAIRYNERAHRSTYFWNLNLPQETRNYIPKLLALVSIIDNPQYYGITLPKITAQTYFEDVSVSGHLPMKVIAGLSATDLATLQEFNSGFKMEHTGPRRHNHVLLPIKNALEFRHNLALNPNLTKDTWEYHTIKHGETLSGIAKTHHTRVAVLTKINHLHNSKIFERQKIMVPVTPAMLAARMKNMKYKIQPGDNLIVLAQRFSTSVAKLKAANRLKNSVIRAGQVLIIR